MRNDMLDFQELKEMELEARGIILAGTKLVLSGEATLGRIASDMDDMFRNKLMTDIEANAYEKQMKEAKEKK